MGAQQKIIFFIIPVFFLLVTLSAITTTDNSSALPTCPIPLFQKAQESRIFMRKKSVKSHPPFPHNFSSPYTSWKGPITLFVGSNGNLSSAIPIPGYYTYYFLLYHVPTRTTLSYFTLSQSVQITHGGLDYVAAFVNGLEITKPDLYISSDLVVHGVDEDAIPAESNHHARYSRLLDKTQPEALRKGDFVMDIEDRLRICGFSFASEALYSLYHQLIFLDNFTLLVVKDALIRDGTDTFFLPHFSSFIIPNYYIPYKFFYTSHTRIFPTLNPKINLTLSRANLVPGLFLSNRYIVVHEILDSKLAYPNPKESYSLSQALKSVLLTIFQFVGFILTMFKTFPRSRTWVFPFLNDRWAIWRGRRLFRWWFRLSEEKQLLMKFVIWLFFSIVSFYLLVQVALVKFC